MAMPSPIRQKAAAAEFELRLDDCADWLVNRPDSKVHLRWVRLSQVETAPMLPVQQRECAL